MPNIAVVPQDPPPPEQPPEPEIALDDPRYFWLSEPIMVAGKRIEKLLIDTSALRGPVYFKLITRLRNEHPKIQRTSINPLGEEIFLGYVVAELNPPLVVEDLAKISFDDLGILFLRMQSFLYLAQVARDEKKKALRAAANEPTL
jgi:hypothetical protein